MKRDNQFSVVICAYTEQRWDDLLAAVDSVRRQTLTPREIIVVVDHNPAMLARVRDEIGDVLAVENHQRQGLSGARNSGLRASSGEYVAFLDDDALAEPDWLGRLAAGYDDPRVVGVGGVIEPLWSGGRPGWFPAEYDWVVGCTYVGMPTRRMAVRNLIGANMSFRRELFHIAGEFTSGIGRVGTRPVGCEETDFCIRAAERLPGSIFLYEPAARVRHRVPPERATLGYFLRRCFAEGNSKVAVTQRSGANRGLSSERAYVLRTLPGGIVRHGLKAPLIERDPAGLGRAVMVALGLSVTTAGYLGGHISKDALGARFARRSRSLKQSVS
ncbi:MAG TPA: glycosyltransferase family 2 protein [Thermomicrobiales bacterium]|nr:glycosyltransferase family 2 protein [Thermomicrobiales bacterium]